MSLLRNKSPHQLGGERSHSTNWCGDKSITLIELLIALTLIGFLAYAVVGHDIFTRHQLVGAERRAKLQNEVSYCLEHMAKYISKGIGDSQNSPVAVDGDNHGIIVDVDFDDNGKRDSSNRKIRYAFSSSGSDKNLITYDDNYLSTAASLPQLSTVTPHIANCTFSFVPGTNYVEANVTACWDPATCTDRSTSDNPRVGMKTRIVMPSVSLQ